MARAKHKPVNMAPCKLDAEKPIPAAQTSAPTKETPPAATCEPQSHNRRKTDSDLMAGLREEYERYRTEIEPLYPSDNPDDDSYGAYDQYDAEKNEFLESLWDVISQHFADGEKE